MPTHIVRLIILIVIFGVVAVGARFFFTDRSFGRYGHYRADSVAEVAADTPIFKGAAYCQSCHGARHAEWSRGVHKVVTCETCHGPATLHPDGKPPAPADKRTHSLVAGARGEHVRLAVPADTVKLCTLCHEKMPGRPVAQRQIEVSSHAGTQQCIACHNPHSPRLTVAAIPKEARAGDAAAGREKAAACASCHGAEGVSANPAWPSLAGQQRAYLASALKAYRSGARQDPVMTGLAQGLSGADIGNLAAYYASLACRSAGSTRPKEEAAAGKGKAEACASCHGPSGISRNPAWPHLAGQQEDYLASALKAYRAGTRKMDAMMVQMMVQMAKNLSDAEIRALAAFYAGSSCR